MQRLFDHAFVYSKVNQHAERDRENVGPVSLARNNERSMMHLRCHYSFDHPLRSDDAIPAVLTIAR